MQKTIVIIDDDPAIVNLLKEDLVGEGYRVFLGYDGQAALLLAREKRPDLIMMDLNMPGVDGVQALQTLRKQEQTKAIPIIFLTGDDLATLPASVQALPRVAHLRKPINLDDLNSKVKSFIQKYPVL